MTRRVIEPIISFSRGFAEADAKQRAFWHSRTPTERLWHLEYLRELNYGPRHLPPDFREFLECLNAAGVEYLLVGGHAVCFHGYPRVTSHMDLWINPTPDNAERVIAAVRRFFADDMPGLTRDQLLDPEMVTHFGARPFLVELLNRISGGGFPVAWSRRVQTVYDTVPVNIIGIDDLRANKRASGRAKDQADLENLPESSAQTV